MTTQDACGTEIGYFRHRRAGEDPCMPCRQAHSTARRDRKYGLAPGEYARMLAQQGGRCLVCGATPSRALMVDHCHETGQVRGLLCGFCNSMLGMALDCPEVLRRGQIYLTGALRSAPDEFLGDLSKKGSRKLDLAA